MPHTRYRVVVNDEDQYSIWAADEPLPPGWHDVGVEGTREECLEHIDTVWTDMRPLSLRRWMTEQALSSDARSEAPDDSATTDQSPSLVSRLCAVDHVVELRLEPGVEGVDGLVAAVRRGHLGIRIPGTRGGTELTIRVNHGASDVTALDTRDGRVRVVGDLRLDGQLVRCEVTIDLPALSAAVRVHLLDAAN
jgi:uncharacterized protein YbdZ (MbtH family)